MSSERVSPVDLRLRLIALALEPALVLAQRSALSLDDLQALVVSGYFAEHRKRGLSLRSIATRMRKSLRTIATLSKRSSAAVPQRQFGDRITLQRKVASYLARHGATDVAALRKLMRDPKLEAELEHLCEQGVLARTGNEIAIAAEQLSLTSEDLEQRLDSVRHFLEAVTQTLHRRFVQVEADKEAFARVLSFSARREDLSALRARYYAELREQVVAADKEAGADGKAAAVAICFVELAEDRPRPA